MIDIGQNDLAAGFRNMTNEKLQSAIPEMMNLFATNVQVGLLSLNSITCIWNSCTAVMLKIEPFFFFF